MPTLIVLTYKIKYSVFKDAELQVTGYHRTGWEDGIPSLYMMTNRIYVPEKKLNKVKDKNTENFFRSFALWENQLNNSKKTGVCY